jgi:hypothetical protein
MIMAKGKIQSYSVLKSMLRDAMDLCFLAEDKQKALTARLLELNSDIVKSTSFSIHMD